MTDAELRLMAAVAYAHADLARLARFVAGHFEVLSGEKRIVFHIEALHAQVDPDKVQRIVLNLLSNALKFTPSGGGVSRRSGGRPRGCASGWRVSVQGSRRTSGRPCSSASDSSNAARPAASVERGWACPSLASWPSCSRARSRSTGRPKGALSSWSSCRGPLRRGRPCAPRRSTRSRPKITLGLTDLGEQFATLRLANEEHQRGTYSTPGGWRELNARSSASARRSRPRARGRRWGR